MKKILMTTGALLLWTSLAVAGGGETVTIPAEDYKAILQKLETLQNRVEQLEVKEKSPSPSGKPAMAAVPEKKVQGDIESIYATLDAVETKTLKDRINLGAELRTRFDNYKVKNHTYFSAPTVTGIQSNDNNWTNRFRLNMDAEIAKNLLFTGRMAVYKNWADSDNPTGPSGVFGDSNRAHLTSDSNLKLDRAYVDWIPEGMPVPFALTFGRHPSSEGPPFEFKENRLRQSTYPALLFDGEADGVVATFGLERYIGWKGAGLRFAYGKAYQDDDQLDTYLDNPSGLDDTNVSAAFFETEIPGLKDSLLVLSALHAEDLSADFTAITGMTGTANIGDLNLYGIHGQANNLLGSAFDLFMSVGLNETDPNGQYITYGANRLGLLNDDGTTQHSGWAVYGGLRYNLAFAPLNDPKIGFEYNHGSDYWFSFTSGSTELYNKLATRGDVYDFYYIQPFNKNLFMRAGFTYADYDYKLSGFQVGDFGNSDEEMRNYYFLLDCRF